MYNPPYSFSFGLNSITVILLKVRISHGVMANMEDCGFEVSKFQLQSRNLIIYRTNKLISIRLQYLKLFNCVQTNELWLI